MSVLSDDLPQPRPVPEDWPRVPTLGMGEEPVQDCMVVEWEWMPDDVVFL